MNLHKLSNVDLANKTAVCSVCGPVKIKTKGSKARVCYNKWREWEKKWHKTPSGKAYRRRHNNVVPYRRHVKPVCELCGFAGPVLDLIDGHHRDGNRENNEADNIQSLCPVCHRLTHLGRLDLVRPVSSHTPDHQNGLNSKETAQERHAAKVLVQCWRNMNAVMPTTPEEMAVMLKGVSRFENKPFTEENLKAIEPHATNQVKLLLDDIERLTIELEAARIHAEEAMMMDLDEKGKLGWKLYYQLKEGKAKGEFDQT